MVVSDSDCASAGVQLGSAAMRTGVRAGGFVICMNWRMRSAVCS